jgi:mutator protein MutT
MCYSTLKEKLYYVKPEIAFDASVGIIIKDNCETLLIKRRENPNDKWSGQVAFPGGRRKEGELPIDTAIREVREEVGLTLKRDNFVAYLPSISPFSFPMKVQPAIFKWEEQEVSINKDEVETYFWVSINDLPKLRGKCDVKKFLTDCFIYNNFVIWGMTYRLLNTIIDLIS